jgi:hypothetical protein
MDFRPFQARAIPLPAAPTTSPAATTPGDTHAVPKRPHSAAPQAATSAASKIETNFTGVRGNPTNRQRFGDASAIVLERFLSTHWGLRLAAQ